MLTEQEIEAGCEVLDGYVIDAQGEVLRLAQKPPFQANTRESADWVLGKMAEQEGHLVAIDRRRKALLANLEQQEKKARGTLAWLHSRFDSELEQLARKELAGGKAKTLVLDHGRIGFRQSKGTNRITDMEKAVEWAEFFCPDAIRVSRSVNVSAVVEAIESLNTVVAGMPADAGPLRTDIFLESSGPREIVSISPGVSEG